MMARAMMEEMDLSQGFANWDTTVPTVDAGGNPQNLRRHQKCRPHSHPHLVLLVHLVLLHWLHQSIHLQHQPLRQARRHRCSRQWHCISN